MRPRIPATVVTGFLGAGKTSLIRHLLETANGRRLALIINEFGDLGVDRGLIAGCGIAGCADEDVIELANGCICCTVADDFLPTIETLLARREPPDHIVVETSGLALPKPLVKAFAWPEVRSRVTVDGVVAVIDGAAVAEGRFADDPEAVEAQRRADPALDHDNPLEEVYEDQLLAADLIVLNKADLLHPEGRRAIRRDLAATLPRTVKVVESVRGRVAPAVLLGLSAAVEDDIENRPSHHDGEEEHDHDDFESFTVPLPEVADPEALARRLATALAAHDILRLKGFAAVPGKELRLVIQGVGRRLERYFDRPWRPDEPRRGEIVVIGLSGLDRAAIAAAIAG